MVILLTQPEAVALEPQGLERVEVPQQGQELPVEPPGREEQLAMELPGLGE